jgi:mRNA-degrading endonuclease toxin of MazEF toxin-antitoxin module
MTPDEAGRDSQITHGRISWVKWDSDRGAEQCGRRPGLVVQTDLGNLSTRYTSSIVVALSSAYYLVPFNIEVAPSE